MNKVLEQAREQKAALYARYRQAKGAALETRDPEERRRQQHRARMLWEMYQEACEEVRRLDPQIVKPKQPRREDRGTGGAALDVLLQSGAMWADLEGHAWSQLAGYTWDGGKAGTGRAAQLLTRMVRDGLKRCTPRQQQYLTAYYAGNATLEEIGQTLGSNKSAVSRAVKRGLRHVSDYVTAKLLLPRCINEQGYFDYLTFVNSAQVLTERQREMLYLMLAKDTSYADISRYVGRHRSAISRTADRVEDRLRGLAVEIDVKLSSVRVRREDWEALTEKELAQQLGLSPRFYYGAVRRGELVGGIPLLHFAALRRTRELGDPGAAAAELGCSVAWVKKLERQYRGAQLPDVPLEPYRPVKPRRIKLPENPYAAIGGDAVIDRIDAATYRALQKRFGTI